MLILACSAGQVSDGKQADDGYTYRIGEVNPYNDNAWHRYYQGVGSGSRINKLYNEIRYFTPSKTQNRPRKVGTTEIAPWKTSSLAPSPASISTPTESSLVTSISRI